MFKLKSLLLTLFSFFIPFVTFAQETSEKALTIDQKIDAWFEPFATAISDIIFFTVNIRGNGVPIVLIILIAGAIFFTLYFKFINFRLIGTAIKVVRGDYDEMDEHGADIAAGDPTPFSWLFWDGNQVYRMYTWC